jgi:phage/plasmid-associated DNA primase
LQDWNNRCDPPWPKDQLQKKVLNAALYATGERGTKLAASSFPRTESGDAEFFAAQFAGKVTYDARRSRWCLLDDDGLWNPDALEQVRNHALDAMRAMQRDALQLTDKADKAAAMKWAIQGEGTKRLNNLVREARTQPAIRVDSQTHPWDPNPWLLGVTGGVVDLRTGEGRKARPEERVTMRAGDTTRRLAHRSGSKRCATSSRRTTVLSTTCSDAPVTR